MAKKKNCSICGDPLNKATKENRTEHYDCRNATLLSTRIFKKGLNAGIKATCKTRTKSGLKALLGKSGLVTRISNLVK